MSSIYFASIAEWGSIMIEEFDEMTIWPLRTLKIFFIFITSQFIHFYQQGSEYSSFLISFLCSLSLSQAILLIFICILAVSRYCCF
jgi:hypothetical protein